MIGERTRHCLLWEVGVGGLGERMKILSQRFDEYCVYMVFMERTFHEWYMTVTGDIEVSD
jgi:hypothetical protein